MTTKRIYESGTLTHDPAKGFRVCLITEGRGSSADFTRSFFTAESAARAGGALVFPGHPFDYDRPEHRDPMSAIAHIDENVTIEEHDGLLSMWSTLIPSKTKPEVASYLEEYGPKLGLSMFSDTNGHNDTSTGRWVAESLAEVDPYRSVDLVVAAGRGGKIEGRIAEALLALAEPSATAEEKKENLMELKDVDDKIVALSKVVEELVATMTGKAKAALQVEADDAAVAKTVESRFDAFEKACGQIAEAKLTDSQSAELRALAKTGVDITPNIESAKKVIAEALALAGDDADGTKKIAEAHLGGGSTKAFDPTVGGFGVVR